MTIARSTRRTLLLTGAAEGLGADLVDVNKPADLQKVWPNVVGRANSGRPQLIVAHVDPKAAPPYWSPPYWQKTVD